MTLLGGLTLARTFRARRLLRRARPVDPALHARAARLARAAGLKRSPEIRLARRGTPLPSPALLGLLRPVVLLPDSAATLWSEEERDAVLLHELLHIRRRDHLVNALQSLVRTVYFFHPFAWFVLRRLRTERELACDDEVVRRIGSNRAYARALLRLVEHRLGSPRWAAAGVGMAEPPASLARRLRRMTTTRLPKLDAATRGRAGILAATLIGLASVGLATDRHATAPELHGADEPGIAAEILFARAAHPGDARAIPPKFLPSSGVSFGREIDRGEAPGGAPLLELDRDILLRARIDVAGRVRDVQVLRGARRDLDRAYTRYLRSFAFEPSTTAAGDPVVVTMLVRFAPPRAPAHDSPLIPGEDGVSKPELVRKFHPEYPELAREARLNGKVILRAVIDREGWVRDIDVVNPPRDDLGFSEAAVAAVSGWRYRPAIRDGEPVDAAITVLVDFTLSKERPAS